MPRRQREPKPVTEAGRALAIRLEPLLLAGPMSMRQIIAALEVDPELVVVALRELRRRDDGRLRSRISLGHVCWWWEPSSPGGRDETAAAPEVPGSTTNVDSTPAPERAKNKKRKKRK